MYKDQYREFVSGLKGLKDWNTPCKLSLCFACSILTCFMLLGYNFKPTPNNCAPMVQRSQFDYRFNNKWMLTLKKPLCREKTRLTRP